MKIAIRYYFTPILLTNTEKSNNAMCSLGCGDMRYFRHWGEGSNWYNT